MSQLALNDKHQTLPPYAGKFALLLFLAALAMLFLSSMLAYALIRVTGVNAPPTGQIHVPAALWASTIVIMISSVTIQHALVCVRREKQSHFKLSLASTLGLALVFLGIQTPSLVYLLREHQALYDANIHLYGLMFILVLLHALHLIGGIIPLGVVLAQALHGRYDHEHHNPVTYVAMYWHFLDVIWVMMFTLLLTLG
jgi:heme/copper-type cytochrome/quinol oxidase subunit 3